MTTNVTEESIGFPNVLTYTFSQVAADEVGIPVVHAPETSLVIHYLQNAILRAGWQCAADASDV